MSSVYKMAFRPVSHPSSVVTLTRHNLRDYLRGLINNGVHETHIDPDGSIMFDSEKIEDPLEYIPEVNLPVIMAMMDAYGRKWKGHCQQLNLAIQSLSDEMDWLRYCCEKLEVLCWELEAEQKRAEEVVEGYVKLHAEW